MKKFFSERGQGLVEYSLILILIAIVVVIALGALGTTTSTMFQTINDSLPGGSTYLMNFI